MCLQFASGYEIEMLILYSVQNTSNLSSVNLEIRKVKMSNIAVQSRVILFLVFILEFQNSIEPCKT